MPSEISVNLRSSTVQRIEEIQVNPNHSAVLDFTSALYLGLQHASHSLRPWRQLTTGAPAALVEPPEAGQIGEHLARLMGCEAGTLGTSTLHLAWDLFGLLSEKPIILFMDSDAYPITRWGAERAAARGAEVRTFPHHDVVALRRELAATPGGRTPVIVTDGFCPACGRVAPLRDYCELARKRGGFLVADDTQALGLLGLAPDRVNPYGRGGGGSFRWSDLVAPNIVIVASLAKAFGVPVAVLGGSRELVERFKDSSETRVHCSPPSFSTLRAAERALALNRKWGDVLRLRLGRLIRAFRAEMRGLGVAVSGGLFPVQTLLLAPEIDAEELNHALARRGMRTVLQSGKTSGRPRVTLALTARHSLGQIRDAAALIGDLLCIQQSTTDLIRI